MHMHISIRFCQIHEQKKYLKVFKKTNRYFWLSGWFDLMELSTKVWILETQGKNKIMYINIYVLFFCFQKVDTIMFFSCFFLNCFRNYIQYEPNTNSIATGTPAASSAQGTENPIPSYSSKDKRVSGGNLVDSLECWKSPDLFCARHG